jgi:hypothetical protein
MNIIQSLITEKFSVFNVGEDKKPVNSSGYGLNDWEKLSYDELCNNHNLRVERWGLKLGEHENGRRIMSFDFDCCGEENKNTGERVGCDYTKEKLRIYLDDKDCEDGLYTSSTRGNMNLLVDYTCSEKMVKIITELSNLGVKNKIKPQKKSLEILIGGCQVIPPSATKCKITKTLGNPRAFLNTKPFYQLDEGDDTWVFNFLYAFFTEHLIELRKTKPLPQLSLRVPPEVSNAKYEDMYLELINNVIGNGCNENGSKKIAREDWLAICYILKSNNYDKQTFINYSNPQADKQKNTAEKTWDTLVLKQFSPLYQLQGIAKRYNPYYYDKWFVKHKKYLKISVLKKGENNVAIFITEPLKSKLVYCNKQWWAFDPSLKIWRFGTPDAIVITEMQRQIDIARKNLITAITEETDEEKKKAYRKKDKEYEDFYTIVGRNSFANQVIKCLKEYLLDLTFEERLDICPYKVAYKNGMLDLKTLIFQEGLKAEDYLTAFIPYDYKPGTKEDIAKVREELKKICNYNEDHLNYYLSFLGYSMTGDSSLFQLFFNLLGQLASNGKSIVFEALGVILPNYVKKAENDIFECNYGSRHKEIATWRGLKILWINELTKKKQDADIIKDISDGTTVTYKVMYGITGKMPIGFKLATIANNSLNINGDRGIARRMKTCQMNSEFLDDVEDNFETKIFKKDLFFGKKLQNEWKYALMSLIYQYSQEFVNDGYKMKPYPSDWNEVSENIIQDNNKFKVYFNTWFIEDPAGKISKTEIDEHLKEYNQHVNLRDELMRLKIPFVYNSQKRCQGSNGVKGIYEGFRMKTDEEKEVENEAA